MIEYLKGGDEGEAIGTREGARTDSSGHAANSAAAGHAAAGRSTRVDIFGEGEDAEAVGAAAEEAGVSLRFLGGRDHADPDLRKYKVFVNPSQTEVTPAPSPAR
eukprot:scaffold215047_cov30-Tisochrysis_lutea.AAC.1